MERFGIVANCSKARAGDVLKRLLAGAKRCGVELICEQETARLVRLRGGLSIPRLFDSVEAVIALGGDGTVLRVVRALAGRDIPVMGVNIGGLGFLTSVSEDEACKAMAHAAANRCKSTVRSIAEAEVIRGGRTRAVYRALNDAVIGRVSSSRILSLEVAIGDEPVTAYQCDGLIVSTPTGSTGHSLSAGGPILTPETHAFVMTLICPHTLTWRPVVIPDTRDIVIRIASPAAQRLTVDGQVGQALREGDAVRVCRSTRSVRFLHMPGHSYFGVLRQKLHWSGSNLPVQKR